MATAAEAMPQPMVIPRGPQETVQQAAAACIRAFQAGVRRQRVELLLPLVGATDLDDWPGGIRQQFKAAQPMVEELLRELKKEPGLEGPLSARIIEDGDAVAAWEGRSLAAVLFPTGETLKEVRKVADARKDGLVLIINPQWNNGNVVSDLGFLPWQRKANEELVAGFREAYILKQLRMNSDDVRLLYSFPSPWQINLSRPNDPTKSECVAQREQRPSYKELEALMRGVDWSMSSKPLGERLQYEAAFLRKSLDSNSSQQPPQ
ncbi:hypothetical protein D9Q98_006700 [Chlorella vulgaris]|uniref:DUF1995 domain-containing protein n=1 Tax=Chlorella vulgaris TaxID=3077 RepID=A0A9D4TL15_CHLVU|nr:hypothetical protein D9Q98_006700 [Chlorella vulgaris]